MVVTRWMRPAILVVGLLLSRLDYGILGFVNAECECGYTAMVNGSTTPYLFTDIIESDFLHISNISTDTDWKRQNFSVTAAVARGTYGMNYSLSNIDSNAIADAGNWTGPGRLGGDPGLRLWVDEGVPANGFVQSAQVASAREDLLWGSYRAGLRLTGTAGTCSSFFWYFNDSQEIDIEFLSSQFNPKNRTFPVNLVLQSPDSVKAGFDAAATGNFVVTNLPFDPTDGYHEYRFDFVPGKVIFYGDGIVIGRMSTSAVPSMPGHLVLTQWSNGNPLWSYGPPTEKAVISVSYVKAYFNSSNPARQQHWSSRCRNPTATGATCSIPDQNTPPDPATVVGNVSAASTYFFSDDKNKTINQTVYHKNGVAALKGDLLPVWTSSVTSLMLVFVLVAALL